ncbi:MAG: hypothetical protein ACFE92_14975 [Promethearchaeota archaeon]
MIQKEKTITDKIIKKFKRLAGRALLINATGKLKESMELIEIGNELIRPFQENLPKELEEPWCELLYIRTITYVKKGYLELFLKLNNEYLKAAKKYDIKKHIALSTYLFGNYYWRSGDLDKALVYIESAIELIEECFNNDEDLQLYWLTEIYYHAIEIAIERKEFEKARKYIQRLKEIKELKPNDPILHNMYMLCKAIYLTLSKRIRDRAKAEALLQKVCKDGITPGWFFTKALIKRCELLLLELKSTEEIEIIDEIKPILEQLIDLAQERESDLLLMQAYVIQGKLALLTFDIKIARRFLIQGQRIAERRGYKSFANEIARLHEDLKGKLDEWEHLKQINAPLSERIKLAKLNEKLSGQLWKREVDLEQEQVIGQKITVYDELKTCIVCKGSAVGFNIYVCPHCNSIYCKGCAKAVIEIENACWTCESPIDKARPSQILEKEKEKTKLDQKKK